jgi:hypothetical protein
LGFARGPKFDAIVEQVFALQLAGRGKTREEREKTLRKLSGIKEVPKKKEKEKKPAKAAEKHHKTASATASAKPEHKEDVHRKVSGKHPHRIAAAAARRSGKSGAGRKHGKRPMGGKKSRARK